VYNFDKRTRISIALLYVAFSVKFVCYRLYSGFRGNHSGKIYFVAMFSLHRHGAPEISDTMYCIGTFVSYKRNASKNNGMNLVHSVNRNSKETPFVSLTFTKKPTDISKMTLESKRGLSPKTK